MQTVYIHHTKCNLMIMGDDDGVVSVQFIDEIHENSADLCAVMQQAHTELMEYLDGVRTDFDVKINVQGTDFQQVIYKILRTIPYGTTATYEWVALQTNNIKNIRAAANANGKNKLLILIPCHRVIGKNGTLTGFAAGLATKQMLIEHEQPNALRLF